VSRSVVFDGQIGQTVADSVPAWPSPPASSSPNILVVILDDTGWADLGCYGSEISTPAIDSLANRGVRFNRFHVTPVCSPTRASLLTGRNHHGVGMRFLADTDTGFPNSRGFVSHDIPMLQEILRDNGYGTYLSGKWHLTPLHEITPAGPYDNWPLARGFDRYYGFLDGCTDQYEPELYADNHPVDVPDTAEYHLTEDLADRAVEFVENHLTFRQGAPFFLQLALGATHAPFQVPREYIDKYLDTFSVGWDQVRDDRLARQKAMNLVPEGTTMTPRNPGVRPWDSLDETEREIYTHLQATFAGFLEHADAQLGRVLGRLEELGVLDDTIVVVLSDNGASREGREHGDVDANAPYSGVVRAPSKQQELLGDLGGPAGGAHYPEGWAMAGNTPFRLYKQFVDLGGSRAPLVMSWPKGSAKRGAIAEEFLHAIDITPTLLALAGIEVDAEFDGASAAATLAPIEPVAPADGRTTQYWEMMGRRAIWHEGWRAVADHVVGTSYDSDVWRLYDTTTDFSESHDVAAEHPDKVKELDALWWAEAQENQVFPLDDRPLLELIFARGPQGLFAQSSMMLFPGQHVPLSSGVTGSNREIVVTARLGDGAAGATGMLLSSGNLQGGFHFYLDGGSAVFEHSTLGVSSTVSAPGVTDRTRTVGFHLVPGDGDSALVRLLIGDQQVAQVEIPRISDHLSFWGMDVGRSARSTFSSRVIPPFELPAGALERLTITVHHRADDVEAYVETALAGE
jgi:arylsulfatase A-like enzyme